MTPERPTRPGEIWKRRCRTTAIVGLTVGIAGLLFNFTRPAFDVLDRLRTLEAFAGAAVIGLIGLFAVGFWRGVAQRPALAGGLISGALFSFALVVGHLGRLAVLCLLLVPVGGAVAVRMSRASQVPEIPKRTSAKIGLQSGLVASVVAFAFGLPVALVIGNAVSVRFTSAMISAAPDVVASGWQNPLATSAEDTFGGYLFISVLVVGLGWLGGAIGGRR